MISSRRRPRAALCFLCLFATLGALLAVPAGGEVVQEGGLIVSFGGSVSPRLLPRAGRAPIGVNVDARVRTNDGVLPPALQRITLDINSNGVLSHRGLAACPIRRLQPVSSADALRVCGDARIGEGRAGGEVLLRGQEPFPFTGRVIAFNGILRGGRPAMLAHLYTTRPIPLTFILPFTIQRTSGTFGTRLAAVVPPGVRAITHITHLSLHLRRTYESGGQQRSYLSAGCPAPAGFPGATFPLVRSSYRFDDGTTLSSVLVRTCHASD